MYQILLALLLPIHLFFNVFVVLRCRFCILHVSHATFKSCLFHPGNIGATTATSSVKLYYLDGL